MWFSSGACSPAMTSIVACICSSFLSSVTIYLDHCSHSLIQDPTFTVTTWKKPIYSIFAACLKMCKRFLATQPVTIKLISLLFSSVPSFLILVIHHLWAISMLAITTAFVIVSSFINLELRFLSLITYHLLLICQDSSQFLVCHGVSLFFKNANRFWKYIFSFICVDSKKKVGKP